MATAKKKVTAPAEPIGPTMYDRRPGDDGPFVASEPDNSLHAFLGAPWLRRGYMDQPALALAPDVLYWLPPRAVASGTDGAKMLRDGTLRRTGGDRAALPEVIDLSDSAAKQVYRDGKVSGPNRQERIAGWRDVVVDGSLAESIVNCEDAGIDGMEAARRLAGVYDSAFLPGGYGGISASDRPWISVANEWIGATKARAAGLMNDETVEEVQ
jgi:hypothetical protein